MASAVIYSAKLAAGASAVRTPTLVTTATPNVQAVTRRLQVNVLVVSLSAVQIGITAPGVIKLVIGAHVVLSMRFDHLLLVLFVAVHATILTFLAYSDTPTVDELPHLVSGLYHLKTGDLTLYCVNPPLVRCVAALPVLLMSPQMQWDGVEGVPARERPEFQADRKFIELNGGRSTLMCTVGRLVCIPFSIIGCLCVAMWSKEWFGSTAGIASAVLWCVSPNILAHGHLLTPDVAATSFGILAAYLFMRWTKVPSLVTSVSLAVGLALALLSKTTWIIFFGVMPLQWLLLRYSECEATCTRWRHFVLLCLVLTTALLAVNHFYGWKGSFRGLGDYEFVSHALGARDDAKFGNRFRATILAGIPVPFPSDFVHGIDVQNRDFEVGYLSYLRGDIRHGGWWWYYIYALLVKTPLAVLALLGLATFVFLKNAATSKKRLEQAIFLLVIPVTVFTLVSSQTGFNHHLRYVLPVLPFGFIWAGQAFSASAGVRCRRIAIVLLVLGAAESLATFPHSISFFNLAVGGPARGHLHLVDSNIDWGQDLLRLKAWYTANPRARPIYVSVFSRIDPEVLGIEYQHPRASLDAPEQLTLADGWYILSVHYLQGMRRLRSSQNSQQLDDVDVEIFQNLHCVDRIGYSLFVFHVVDGKSKSD